ncbi:glycosyltransferase family 2 protein [Scytonema hofmannii]|nr:glycosyltransferase [Scytonema hofmannii]
MTASTMENPLVLETSTMENPLVTLIVVPRERFSYSRESLESIYKDTNYPFDLVYVDCGSPSDTRRYLEEQAQQKQFKLIRSEYFLSPNRARNIGRREVKTKYIVFIDNDVIVKPGWLEKLVQCAEETGAGVVGPLTCIGKPEHEIIHNAGGKVRIVPEIQGDKTVWRNKQKAFFNGTPMAEVRDQLHRIKCDYVELHCVLVRTELFDRVDLLDEGLLNTREYIDLCLMATQAGSTIYCERESVVFTDTLAVGEAQKNLASAGYIQGTQFQWSDLHFFMVRWSDAWELESLHYFRDKWNLSDDDAYLQKRYRKLGHRRHEAWLKPLIRRFTFGRDSEWLEKILMPLERRLNRWISNRYEKFYPQSRQAQASKQPESSGNLITAPKLRSKDRILEA